MFKVSQTKMGKIPGTIALLACVAGIAQSIPIPHDANNDHDCGTHQEQEKEQKGTPLHSCVYLKESDCG